MDRAVRTLYVATFLYTFAQAVGLPLIPEYLSLDFGATLRFIGLVLSLYGLMQIVLRLPMGDLADRRGRKPSLVLAFLFTLASALLFVFAQNAWWSVPAVAFFGFSGGIFWVAANSYLFDRVHDGDVAKATSDYSLAVGLAFLVGPPVGHIVADLWGFRAAFALLLGSGLAGLALVMTLPETPPAPRPRPTTSPYRRALHLLKHPALRYSAAGTFLYSVLFSTMNSFFQLHMLSVGLGLVVIGAVLAGRQAAATVIRVGMPAALRRYGPRHVLLWGVVVTALSTAVVPWATTLPILLVVAAVGGAASGAMIPANLMLVHEGAPKDERGLANGIYGTMLGLGSAFAPLAFGALGDSLGPSWSFWGAGALALALAAILATRLYRAPPAGARV